MQKILFTRPALKQRMGGVTDYTNNLIKNLDPKMYYVVDRNKYLTRKIEKTTQFENFLIKIAIISYFFIFPFRLVKEKIDLVHSNPSLGLNAVLREAIYILIAKTLRIKVFVFFHGWNHVFAKNIESSGLLKRIFVTIFNNADSICVLAEDFKKTLVSWGIKTNIDVETTMVSDQLSNGFDIENAIILRKKETKNILFISRLEKSKGIFEAIDAIDLLVKKNIKIRLVIAGDGPHSEQIIEHLREKDQRAFTTLGFIEGKKKRKAFEESFAMLFPTQYGEGMPIAVLEAISFGLPVITRSVGGLKDFFINEKTWIYH